MIGVDARLWRVLRGILLAQYLPLPASPPHVSQPHSAIESANLALLE
jgi:hypothetical protein